MAGATRQNQSSVELFAIYEVSKILSSSLDLQQTLREVLRLLSYHLQMQRGRICLLTDDSTLKLIAALGMSQEEMERGHYRYCWSLRLDDRCHAEVGASAVNLDRRVWARGLPWSHASRRSRFMATAVKTCWRWVFACPR